MLVHDFDACFGPDVRGRVLGNFAPQSILLQALLSSDVQISVLFTIGSVRIISISLLLTRKFYRIQIRVLAIHLGDFLIAVFSWAESRLILSWRSQAELHVLVRVVPGQLRVFILAFYLVSVRYL